MGTGFRRNSILLAGAFLAAELLGAFDDKEAYLFDLTEYTFYRHKGGKKAKIRRFWLSFPLSKASRYYDDNCVEIYARTAAQATAIFTKKVKSEDDFILLYIKQQTTKQVKYHGKTKSRY